jgi:succinate dehydrogenase flavin-adding protein (antitoxin of CptAB toxin-antitoxin module)
MNKNFIEKYKSSDEDEKMDMLINVIEQIDDDIYQFLLEQLNSEDDEFVLVEIIKVLSLYSPAKYNDEIIQILFEIIESSDDDLVQSYAIQGLDHLNLSEMDYKKIKDIDNQRNRH